MEKPMILHIYLCIHTFSCFPFFPPIINEKMIVVPTARGFQSEFFLYKPISVGSHQLTILLVQIMNFSPLSASVAAAAHMEEMTSLHKYFFNRERLSTHFIQKQAFSPLSILLPKLSFLLTSMFTTRIDWSPLVEQTNLLLTLLQTQSINQHSLSRLLRRKTLRPLSHNTP